MMEKHPISDQNVNIVPETVSVEDMMIARDRRAYIQNKLLKEYNCPVISFTMNIAGPIKINSDIAYAFFLGVDRIKAVLTTNRFTILKEETIKEKTGFEYFASVLCDASALKAYMTAIEDYDAIGRLFDIDIITPLGEKLSRLEKNQMRKCLICGENAFVCARSRVHTADELFSKAVMIIRKSKKDSFVKQMGKIAQRSLFYEVAVSPKPGLVDRYGNGSHRDMDFYSFIRSGSFLRDYFEACVQKGITFSEKEYSDDHLAARELFEAINTDGILAENGMFVETGGINTHKGLIFSFGIILASIGYLYRENRTDMVRITEFCSLMGRAASLRALNPTQEKSGSSDYEKNSEGIYKEALSGYRTVTECSLPFMEEILDRFNKSDLHEDGALINLTGILVLLKLISVCSDTNMIKRSGKEAAEKLKTESRVVLDELLYEFNEEMSLQEFEELVRQRVHKLDDEFVTVNASPGGCADLLAATFLLYDYLNDPELRKITK